jgi:hypothetical protein
MLRRVSSQFQDARVHTSFLEHVNPKKERH